MTKIFLSSPRWLLSSVLINLTVIIRWYVSTSRYLWRIIYQMCKNYIFCYNVDRDKRAESDFNFTLKSCSWLILLRPNVLLNDSISFALYAVWERCGDVIFPITSPDTNRLLNALRHPLTTQANPQGERLYYEISWMCVHFLCMDKSFIKIMEIFHKKIISWWLLLLFKYKCIINVIHYVKY